MDKIKNCITEFIKEEDGIGVVEIILILVVLVSLVLLFKDQITSIVNQAFTSITGDAKNIIN